MKKLIIYTDGGARGNPGPAAAGIVFYNDQQEKIAEFSKFLGHVTNNQAEYKSLILALEKAKTYKPQIIEVFLDSELVVNQLSGHYRVKNKDLKPLYQQVLKLTERFDKISFFHTLRKNNKLADKLVSQTLDIHLQRH